MSSRLTVRVTPRSRSDVIEGFDMEGVLHVRVQAPPLEGQANEAVAKLLAKALGLPSRDVALVAGPTARMKVFEVALEREEVERRLRTRQPG